MWIQVNERLVNLDNVCLVKQEEIPEGNLVTFYFNDNSFQEILAKEGDTIRVMTAETGAAFITTLFANSAKK